MSAKYESQDTGRRPFCPRCSIPSVDVFVWMLKTKDDGWICSGRCGFELDKNYRVVIHQVDDEEEE